MKSLLFVIALLLISGCSQTPQQAPAKNKGNVIFLHPDGTGVGHWNFLRLVTQGPDGFTNWDRMKHLGIYRPHQKNWLVTSSNAGATTHAYGKKVDYDSYGMDGTSPITALSGKPMSIMQEAQADGIRVGVVNSGHIGEPGSGVFVASSETRKDRVGIAEKVLTSGADVIFSGGEIYALPRGVMGQHGQVGVRDDGRNLLDEAKQAGYTVIFSKEQLLNLPANTNKVIGMFAAKNTYNSKTEEALKAAGLPAYNPNQPTFAEMVEVALRVLSADPKRQFFLVAEEEGTDNFSNSANASGLLEALKRTDAAIGASMDFIQGRSQQDTLLLVAADSDAGHPAIWAHRTRLTPTALPDTTETGAELDGIDGTGSAAFQTLPDARGERFYFGVAWPMTDDGYGSVVAKAHGYGSDNLGVVVDNTDIYRLMYQVLFAQNLD